MNGGVDRLKERIKNLTSKTAQTLLEYYGEASHAVLRPEPKVSDDHLLAAAPLEGQDICIFAHNDHDGRVRDFVLNYLQTLVEHGFCILFVSASPKMANDALDALNGKAWRVVTTSNRGRNWGLYNIGRSLIAETHPGNALLLTNDSCFSTMNAITRLVERCRSGKADITGVVDSNAGAWHIQSFFIYCAKAVVGSAAWADFWKTVSHKKRNVRGCEIRFSQHFLKSGFSVEAAWRYDDLAAAARKDFGRTFRDKLAARFSNLNPAHHFWDILIKEGSPFLNRELIETNPYRIPNLNKLMVANAGYTNRFKKRQRRSELARLPRQSKLLTRISKDQKVVELGPSYNPLITREDGWNCYSIDHGTQEELKSKYGSNPEASFGQRIQPVDFVWRSGPLESAISAEHLGTFDALIASHVIEHTPDFVGFFKSAAKIVRAGGCVSLAVPDKRYCFDFVQSPTLTGDILAAHQERRTRHTKRTLFNAFAYSMNVNGHGSAAQAAVREMQFFGTDLEAVKRVSDETDTSENSAYVDSHAWYFTPSSFRLICYELRVMGLLDFREVEFYDTVGNEFIITMQHAPSSNVVGDPNVRLALLRRMLVEIGEQVDFLREGMADIVDDIPVGVF